MKLHLGCGGIIYPGWENIDNGRRPGEVYHDLRNPLPYKPNTVDFIFSEHFFEHLTRDEGVRLLKECHRVLKPNGVLRTTQPSLESLIAAYNRNDITGQAWSPRNKCHLINEGLRLWEHKHVYDFEDWEQALKEAGFSKAYRASYHSSEYPELCKLEWRPYYGELIVEAIK